VRHLPPGDEAGSYADPAAWVLLRAVLPDMFARAAAGTRSIGGMRSVSKSRLKMGEPTIEKTAIFSSENSVLNS
jgi:hypothetical protein